MDDGLSRAEQALIRRCVRRYAPVSPWIDADDLYCIGRAGLLLARHEHDPERHPHFPRYAAWCVKTAILAAMRSASPLPEWLQKYAARAGRAATLLAAHGHPVTDETVSRVLDVDQEEHRRRQAVIGAHSRVEALPADWEGSAPRAADDGGANDGGTERRRLVAGAMVRLEREHPDAARILHRTVIAQQEQMTVTRAERMNLLQVQAAKARGLRFLRDYLEESGVCEDDLLDGH